ncbi:MAG: hypothetical protein CMH55_07560 [Myxococcales bacterium]|nr:hypothetical protein [Myxococcales bacterium]
MTDTALTSILKDDSNASLSKAAKVFAQSDLVPPIFRNDHASCFLAAQYAVQMGLPALTVMQAMYVPKRGAKVGFSAEFYLGRLIDKNLIVGTVSYEVFDLPGSDGLIQNRFPDIGVTATVIDRATGVEHSETITMRQAVAEGWAKPQQRRDGSGELPSKYQTMPEQMLKKRAVTWLIRNHYPNVMQGAAEVTELEDVQRVEEAREAEVVKQDIADAFTPASKRTKPAEEPEPAEPPPVPHGGIEDTTEGDILDWMAQDGVDARAVNQYLKDAYEALTPTQLSEAQGQELLELLQAGRFERRDTAD